MIKISAKSLEILRICLTKHNPDLLNVIRNDYNSEFDNDLYNELREAVCDELIINGFKDGKASEYGIELENLIDEIGRLFM